MAIAKYNVTVANWAASEPCDIHNMLNAVELSLRFTRSTLINNAGLSMEQEGWIYSQSRSLLSSLTETRMKTINAYRSWSFIGIVEELTKICKDIPRGHEMVPEEFLAIRPRGGSRRAPGAGLYFPIIQSLTDLKYVIRQQQNVEQHAVRFRLQLTPMLGSHDYPFSTAASGLNSLQQ